ncbi:MAG TPA: MFS transporter [Desulfuromonadaceae bacterium]|nr:MFS transporter [Desulfuromonadaceae bacterium]
MAADPTFQPEELACVAKDETLLSSLRALPRPAWILCLGTFLNKFGAFVVPFLTLYLTARGHTVGEAGVAIAAYGVGHVMASLIGGYLADHLGRRKTIALSMFMGAAMMLLLSQAQTMPAIVVLAMLTGLASEFYRPASSALLTDLVPAGRRVTAFAALRMAFNAGFAFGPATAGFLATFGFFWLFVGDAATSLLFGLVALFALPKTAHAGPANAGWGEALKVLRHDHRLHQLLLANFAVGLVLYQMVSTFGLHVTHLGFSPAVYGVVISLNGALVVIAELPLTAITRRFPARRVMATGQVLLGAGFALNAFAHSIGALVVCMVLFTLGEMITMPTAAAYLANLAPAHMRGRYMGVSGLTWALALIIGPAFGMKLYMFNATAYWVTGCALGLFAAIVISYAIDREKIENRTD